MLSPVLVLFIFGACAFFGFLFGWWLRGVTIGYVVMYDDNDDMEVGW